MSSTKRRIVVCTVILVLLVGTTGIVLATPSKPYSDYGCHFHDNRPDLGTAFTDRCSCNPVNNFLAARVKIQGKNGNNYDNTAWSNWTKGSNVETKYVRQTLGSGTKCTYIWGQHKARCGSGSKTYIKYSEIGR